MTTFLPWIGAIFGCIVFTAGLNPRMNTTKKVNVPLLIAGAALIIASVALMGTM